MTWIFPEAALKGQLCQQQQRTPDSSRCPPPPRMRHSPLPAPSCCSVAWFYLCPQIFPKNYKILKWREHRSHDFWVSTVYTVLSHGKLLIYTFSFKIYINVADQNVHSALLLQRGVKLGLTTLNETHTKHGKAKPNFQQKEGQSERKPRGWAPETPAGLGPPEPQPARRGLQVVGLSGRNLSASPWDVGEPNSNRKTPSDSFPYRLPSPSLPLFFGKMDDGEEIKKVQLNGRRVLPGGKEKMGGRRGVGAGVGGQRQPPGVQHAEARGARQDRGGPDGMSAPPEETNAPCQCSHECELVSPVRS